MRPAPDPVVPPELPTEPFLTSGFMMPNGTPLKVLSAASEVVGFAKTGGLADVAGALPGALRRRGADCAVVLPLYHSVRTGKAHIAPTGHSFAVPIANRTVVGSIWQSALPGTDVPVYLIEQPDYFERDDMSQGRGLYQFALPGGQKRDYPDNCERFIFFGRAVLEAIRLLRFSPDILHLSDWQTGLAPVYLREEYGRRDEYRQISTLFTIHNLAYQGLFWHWDMLLTGLDWRLFNYRELEFHGHLNFLKAGIVFSDFISTVSPTYAKEIQTPYFGCGLESVLSERRDRLAGIVNGVDYGVWDPAHDAHLAATYDINSVEKGKPACKAALQRRFGLPERAGVPLLGMIARLVEQKGFDLIGKTAVNLLQQDLQLVVLGEGDAQYHRLLVDLRSRFPERMAVSFSFDEPLAHQIEAGADIYLMPSQYEPAGLNQLYSLKYGTVPVVHATGGLADTITPCTAETLAAGTATGFTFVPYTASAFGDAVGQALALRRQQPEQWLALMKTGMRQNWSWDRIAGEYLELYQSVRKVRIAA
jgi:starch synthase